MIEKRLGPYEFTVRLGEGGMGGEVYRGTGNFSVGVPLPPFQIVDLFAWTYDVTGDGQRFQVREPLTEGDVSPITRLTDWTMPLARQ